MIDPITIAAARKALLTQLEVGEVSSLVHILVMAAQGFGSFAVSATTKATSLMNSSSPAANLLPTQLRL